MDFKIIPIEEDLESQKVLGITEQDLEDKKYWELAVDAGLINSLSSGQS